MKIGFTLSPGGLMLPYHVGALAALQYNGVLSENSPVAGSSAGSIAAVAHSCGIDPRKMLEVTIEVSEASARMGGARGRLLPLLKEKMKHLIDEEAFLRLCERPGPTGVAFREVFPRPTNFLQTTFRDEADLIRSTSFSCMFPFFSTNWPCALDTSSPIARLVVDGFFTVPRDRFGCPDFEMANVQVDRTVALAVFPSGVMNMAAFNPDDIISPSSDTDLANLFRIATQSTSRQDLTGVYEQGWKDAERWCVQELARKAPLGLVTMPMRKL
jgi:hypothetical protein